MKVMYVYILSNKKEGVLYVGVTSNLKKRVWEHKHHVVKGFTQRYNIDKLVYFEMFNDELAAITREKQLKGKRRDKKISLIEQNNPEWRDLFSDICA